MINLVVIRLTKGLELFQGVMHVDSIILFSNVIVVFLLNVTTVFFVEVKSDLILTLANILKTHLYHSHS